MNADNTDSDEQDTEQPAPSYFQASLENTKEEIRNPKFYLEILAILGLFAYTSVSAWQGCETHDLVTIAQNTYNSSQRAYIGVSSISVEHYGRDKTGKLVVSLCHTPDTTNMRLAPIIDDFGPVPGPNFYAGERVFVNGVEQPSTGVEYKPTTIFPHGPVTLGDAVIGSTDYPGVINGTKSAVLEVTIDYDTPVGHIHECNKQQYRDQACKFYNLGSSCTHP